MKMLTKTLITSWLFLMAHIQRASGQCTDRGRFGGRIGAICKHVCHCAGSAECDKNTGACTSCASGYSGSTCQTQNVALRKTGNQVSTLSRKIDASTNITYPANLAVDGDTSTSHTDAHPCTHTATPSNGWWYVDLGAEYSIRYLRVYNRKGSVASRLGGFTVRIGNSIPQIDTPLCYHNLDTTPPEVIDVTCGSTLRGRYVRIGLDSSSEYLTLCEVQVLVCTDYSFGVYCNKRCHCKRETEVCDKVTGNCSSGCATGYTSVDCQAECPIDYYGDCKTMCSTHCIAAAGVERHCNFISGHCTTGCQAGYTGAKCDQECPMDYYGDCMAPCSKYCLAVDVGTRQCNFVSGHCTHSSGCHEYYNGAKCDQGPCSPNHFGKMCRSECHCGSVASECDQHTGACFSGLRCASGYHGNTCQKQNVALEKTTNQSSSLSSFSSAGLAVNGDTSTNHTTHPCAHTLKVSNEWWYVDLGSEYNIAYLRVYNRKGITGTGVNVQDRLRGFVVRIGNSSPHLNTLPFCYQHPNTTPAELIDVNCTRTMKGRYVRISLESGIEFLTLCEVQVFVCTDYSFGEQCTKRCNCRGDTEVCDKVTGACKFGCAAGYQDVDCQRECAMDTYGDCATPCSTHCIPADSGNRQCNLISGNCTNTTGCQRGYIGARCDDECSMDTYGDCKTPCSTHCLAVDGGKRKCNRISGHCKDITGCQAGYTGLKCDQECADGRFGENCRETCNCGAQSTGCDKATGVCIAICPAGFQGENCKTECSDHFFGLGCAKRCNCLNETEACNKRTGACSSGCAAEFEGQDCKIVAADGLKIAALVIGGLLVLALIATLFVIYSLRRKLDANATLTKASLVGQVGQPTYQDLAHNIDANEAEISVTSPADIVIEYEMEGCEYDEIPQITANERQH